MIGRDPVRLVVPVLMTIAVSLTGCASRPGQATKAQQQFAAGQESILNLLQQSGIAVVRVVGPFQRPMLAWKPGMTLAQVILEAGYLEARQPGQIFIERGGTVLPIELAELLDGKDVPVESGDVIHVRP
jgi:hypothetical protein